MKSNYTITLRILALCFGLFLLSCDAESSRTKCDDDSDCKNNRICVDNYCRVANLPEPDAKDSQASDVLENQEDENPEEGNCTPDCFGRQCGPDPVCGELCGPACPDEFHCVEGNCEPGSCIPDCGFLECGPDPLCGTSCGSCPVNFDCVEGECEEGECIPECMDQECGPDPVCGYECGTCGEGTSCDDGQCVEEPCDCSHLDCGPHPSCDSLYCGGCYEDFVCIDGECVEPECTPNCSGRECGPDPVCEQTCGTCTEGSCNHHGMCVVSCNPTCDPSECMECEGTECVFLCSGNESCMDGVCFSSPCDPHCTGDLPFCNEINECTPAQCEAQNCTQFDPNLHCAETEEDVGCFCNPGWVLNEDRNGCVVCEDDDTGNTFSDPTEVDIPFDHTGILCEWDLFAFDLEEGTTVIIDLDEFEPGLNDLDLYLLLDNQEGIIAKRSESPDQFEHIVYTATETQTYYLIVSPYSGPMPAEYHLNIRDTCESDEECGGFFGTCNNSSRCEINCEDDGIPNLVADAEETDLPIEDLELNICLDRRDVFLFSFQEMDNLSVELTFIHDDGDLNVYLFLVDDDPESPSVANSESTDDNESFSYTVEETGDYYLIIAGEQNAYTLNAFLEE